MLLYTTLVVKKFQGLKDFMADSSEGEEEEAEELEPDWPQSESRSRSRSRSPAPLRQQAARTPSGSPPPPRARLTPAKVVRVKVARVRAYPDAPWYASKGAASVAPPWRRR
jgi:hypothetical protein